MNDRSSSDHGPDGQRYHATVPDTLDLADRAALAINGLGGVIDTELGHHMFFTVMYDAPQPYLSHLASADSTCDPKFAQSLPMLRLMSGSTQHVDVEAGHRAALLARIDHGMYWDRYDPLRPWRNLYGAGFYGEGKDEDFCNISAHARMIRAMLSWRELGHGASDGLAGEMVDAMRRVAVMHDDYCYYPDKGGWGEPCCYPRSGWLSTDEARSETDGAEGSIVSYHGNQIYAAAQWYAISGDPDALDLAERLTRYCMKPKFWGGAPDPDRDHSEGLAEHVAARLPDPPFTAGHEHGHWYSHFHARALALRGVFEYARSVNDERALEFVRRAYEFTMTQGIARIGWVNTHPGRFNQCEGCALGDLVAMGIRLSDAGLGDYWDDVDAVVRNHLAEQQFMRADLLEQIGRASTDSDAPDARLPFPGERNTDNVIARSLGVFGALSLPSCMPRAYSMGCCNGNASQALYYAWEGAVREQGDTAQVNLLLNRAARLVDIDSHLPYDGKVVLHNKAARRISVRVPFWVSRRDIRLQIAGTDRPLEWLGSFLVLNDLSPGHEITLSFPVRESTASYTVNSGSPDEQVYRCTFRGSTVVDISPRDTSPTTYPMYQRDHLRGHEAPMKNVERFVPSQLIVNW